MDAKKDAYGQELYARYKDPDVLEITERDDGYIHAGKDFINTYFSQFKDWPNMEKEASKFVRGKILDIGCGAGRVALHFQKRGHKVVSIDNSPLAIKVCKLRGVKDARVMPILDIHKFKPGTFDTIVMFGHNFGLFGTYNRAKRLLKDMYKITSDDARIIADTNDVYKTQDPAHIAYHQLNKKNGKMPGQIKIRVRYKKFIGNWFDYLFVSREEMEEMVDGTGWRIIKFIPGNKSYAAIIGKE